MPKIAIIVLYQAISSGGKQHEYCKIFSDIACQMLTGGKLQQERGGTKAERASVKTSTHRGTVKGQSNQTSPVTCKVPAKFTGIGSGEVLTLIKSNSNQVRTSCVLERCGFSEQPIEQLSEIPLSIHTRNPFP